MKENQLVRPETAPTDHETVTMSIDDAGLNVLMHNLTNLYSNPRLAVLREYAANAWDAHVMAGGGSAPILISLPTHESDSALVIQDFGVGLSKEELANVYARYGASTKRDTNKQIGAFGLGAKSALAITERFDIVSVKDGVKNTVYVEKNHNGVGVFHFVSAEPTADPNGVTVSIPMTSFDVPEDFFAGWPVGSVIVDGVLHGEASVYNRDRFWAINDGGNALGWVSINTRQTSSYPYIQKLEAMVGGVLYNVKGKEVEGIGGYNNNPYRDLYSYHRDVFLNLPIGSVDLTPSREELRYTDRTKKALFTALTELRSRVPSVLQATVESFNTRWDVANFIRGERNGNLWADANFRWRGEEVPNTFKISPEHWVSVSRENKAKGKTVTTSYSQNVTLEQWIGFGREVVAVKVNSLISVADVVKDFKTYLDAGYDGVQAPLLFVTDLEEADSPWLAETMKFVDLDVFRTSMREFRSAARAAAKAARGGATVTSTRPPQSHYVLRSETVDDYTSYKVISVTESEMKTDKVLYVHQGKCHINLQSLFPNVNRVNSNGSDMISNYRNTWDMVNAYFSDYEIVFLPGQRSLAKFKESFPNAEPLGDLLAAKGAELRDEVRLSGSMADVISIARAKNYRVSAWLNRLSEFYKKAVEMGKADQLNSNTTAVLERLVAVGGPKKPHIALHWSGYDAKTDTGLQAEAEKLVKFADKYPLLAAYPQGFSNETDFNHGLIYIQAIDSLESNAK